MPSSSFARRRDFAPAIFSIGAYAPYPAIKILAAFNRRHPDLEVSLHFANSRTLEEELKNHDIDVAVTGRWESTADLHALSYRRLSTQVAIVGREYHPWSRRRTGRRQELAGQRIILREPGSLARRATEDVIAQCGGEPEKIIEIGSRDGVMAAVAEGVGISTIFDEGIVPDEYLVKLPAIPANARRSHSTARFWCDFDHQSAQSE